MADPLGKVTRDLQRLKDKTYRDVVPFTFDQTFYYAYGYKEVKNYKRELVTKLFVDGPYVTKREAELALQGQQLDSEDVFESKSKDLKKVKKEIAAVLTHEHKLPIEVATQRKYKEV